MGEGVRGWEAVAGMSGSKKERSALFTSRASTIDGSAYGFTAW